MRGRALIRLSVGCAAAAAAAGVLAGPAGADVGAGIGADPILLPSTAMPGHSYSMTPVYVVNTGTEASRFQLVVERVRPNEDTTVPKQWVEFARNDFTLGPKETTTVPVKLTVPSDAKPGTYSSNIIVGSQAVDTPPGAAALGARAATDLKFQVTKTAPLIPWPWPWWSYAALGGAAVLGGGAALTRRLGIRIQFERRP